MSVATSRANGCAPAAPKPSTAPKAAPPADESPKLTGPLKLTEAELAILREYQAGNIEAIKKDLAKDRKEVTFHEDDLARATHRLMELLAAEGVEQDEADEDLDDEEEEEEGDEVEEPAKPAKPPLGLSQAEDAMVRLMRAKRHAMHPEVRRMGHSVLWNAIERFELAEEMEARQTYLLDNAIKVPREATLAEEMARLRFGSLADKDLQAARDHLIAVAFLAGVETHEIPEAHGGELPDGEPFGIRIRNRLVWLSLRDGDNGEELTGWDRVDVRVVDLHDVGDMDVD